MVARDAVLAKQLTETGREAFGHLARVHENERRAMLLDERRHAGVDRVPLLVGTHVFEW